MAAVSVENIRQICQNIGKYPSDFPKFQSKFRTGRSTATPATAAAASSVFKNPSMSLAADRVQKSCSAQTKTKRVRGRTCVRSAVTARRGAACARAAPAAAAGCH